MKGYGFHEFKYMKGKGNLTGPCYDCNKKRQENFPIYSRLALSRNEK